jgi:aspartyl-tRNA(Asn)/glutamyl-tRNA(Gln) amidotransferase subunit A
MKTIAEIHAAFEARKISPTELAQEYLGRVKTEKLGAYLTLTEARALDQATQAQKRLEKEGVEALKKVPLLGIPTGIKDVFAQAGVRTTCASKMLESYVAPYTATAVARLEAAGAVTLGKLNMDEFAMGGSNENSAFGPVQHPTHPGRVPGGSSGGSAAAVKGDLCVVALGTDTGGSVRLPASYCGVVGFKPTYGAVSRFGLVAFASSLDQAGPMANRVEDAARVLEVMSGHDSLDSTSMERPPIAALKASRETPNWKGLRIGVPEEYFGGGLQAEVEGSVRQALRWFESQGARLIPIRLAHTRYAVAAYYLIAVSEASSNLARFDGVRYGTRSAQADAAADLARRSPGRASGEGDIDPFDVVGREQGGEARMGGVGLGRHDHPRGVLVEPMDDARPLDPPDARQRAAAVRQ